MSHESGSNASLTGHILAVCVHCWSITQVFPTQVCASEIVYVVEPSAACMQDASKAAERRVVVWQMLIALVLVVAGAVLTASLIVMPRTGYACKACDSISCQDFLGWHCRCVSLLCVSSPEMPAYRFVSYRYLRHLLSVCDSPHRCNHPSLVAVFCAMLCSHGLDEGLLRCY
jgi:hypothetical protein